MGSEKSVKPSARGGGLSLYANLLNSDAKSADSPASNTSISRSPVIFRNPVSDIDVQQNPHDVSSAKKQINAGRSLAHDTLFPTKRPQSHLNKIKPKGGFTKLSATNNTASSSGPRPTSASNARPTVKTTLADWTGIGDDDDVNGFYGGSAEKRQRGGRKKRKKNNREEAIVAQDWDDIYDPSRPNNYGEYKHSEEKIQEVRDWKDRLYAHRIARNRRGSIDVSSEEEGTRHRKDGTFNHIAPPLSYSFAPPPSFDEPSPLQPAPSPPTAVPIESSGEDAYARRLRLSQDPHPAPPAAFQTPPLPPPPPPSSTVSSSTIARAPVRYSPPPLPPPPPSTSPPPPMKAQLAASTEPPVRSTRPGQAGFAARILSRYGWTPGTGLGASSDGIIAPLRVQVEKSKRKSDAEGGGLRNPGGARGKIIGGKRKQVTSGTATEDEKMTEVVRLVGLVDAKHLDQEGEEGKEGEWVQGFGEKCGQDFGRIERIVVERGDEMDQVPVVLVRFTSQLSALRALTGLSARNGVEAHFWSTEDFENGIYG